MTKTWAPCLGLFAIALGCNRDVANAAPAEGTPASSPPAPTAKAESTSAAKEGTALASAKIDEESFLLTAEPKGPYAAGKPAQFEIVLVAKGGYKCNDQYPYKFKASDSPGIEFPEKTVTASALKLEKHRAVMTVPFTPKAVGQKTVAGEFAFSVCTEERCLVERRELSLGIDVR
jgi:hypothetical protein